MIYGINDRIPIRKLILFSIQLLLSVFVATTLIANICGVPVSGALFGAGMATTMYLLITHYKSPMYISNSGAFVAPVLAEIALGGMSAVMIGGLTTCIIYCLFGIIFTKISVEKIYYVFPRAIIGAITVVIGITLMGFIGTYVQINGETNIYGIVVALLTAIIIAIISHYAKGAMRVLPFFVGTIAGYIISIILTLTGVCKLVDFSVFNNLKIVSFPDIAILHLSKVTIGAVIAVVIVRAAYTVSAMMESLSDHAALSGVVDQDLYVNPGLGRIFVGEGVANLFSSMLGGLGACSYGEGIACVGFSGVASTEVTALTALMMMILAFISPVQAFIASIPACVFGGAAIILYGYIVASGIRILQKVDINNQKNLILVSSVLSIGISGIAIGNATFALSGTALALIFGVILNTVLKEEIYE